MFGKKSATIDIAQSTIDSLSLEEVLAFEEDRGEAFMSQMMKENLVMDGLKDHQPSNQKLLNFIKEYQKTIFYLLMERQEQIFLQF